MHVKYVEKNAHARFARSEIAYCYDLAIGRRHHHIAWRGYTFGIAEEIKAEDCQQIQGHASPRCQEIRQYDPNER
jgi:hypothetical protein